MTLDMTTIPERLRANIATQGIPRLALELVAEPGWAALVEEALHAVMHRPPSSCCGFRSTKEKFGSLRFEWAMGDEPFIKFLWELEAASATICGVCGAEGESTSHGGWVRTLCPTHLAVHLADPSPPRAVRALIQAAETERHAELEAAARAIGTAIARDVRDTGNARIGERLKAFFRLDEPRADDA